MGQGLHILWPKEYSNVKENERRVELWKQRAMVVTSRMFGISITLNYNCKV